MSQELHKSDLLKLFPDFKKSQNFIDDLLDSGSVVEIPARQTLLDTGDYIKLIPFLIKGLIKIYREDSKGNELLLYYIKSGESCVISITASLKGEKSTIKAHVEEDSLVLAVPIDKFEYLLGKYDLLHTFTYDLFNNKYNQLINSIDSLAFTDVRSRLLEYLKKAAEAKDSSMLEGLTHRQIANDLSTSREVVSRLLSALQKENKITIANKKITINTISV